MTDETRDGDWHVWPGRRLRRLGVLARVLGKPKTSKTSGIPK
jgi:hypothetical protein